MLPDIDTRLHAMLRSLKEVVLPAIDPQQRLALDQVNIIIGNLNMLIGQHDRQVHYLLAEMRDYSAMLRELAGLAATADAESESFLAEIEPLLAVDLPLPAQLVDSLRQLKGRVDARLQLLLDSAEPGTVSAAQQLVIKYARPQLLRERAWVVRAGFELEPDNIPTLDTLINGAG